MNGVLYNDSACPLHVLLLYNEWPPDLDEEGKRDRDRLSVTPSATRHLDTTQYHLKRRGSRLSWF